MDTENILVDKTEDEIPLVEKKKNPKRVEQGRKLAEWNRKNKANLTPVSEEFSSPTDESATTLVKKSLPENFLFLGGLIIVGGIVIGASYFMKRGAEVSSPKESSPAPKVSSPDPQLDPFDMA